jgi:hypothetical protein
MRALWIVEVCADRKWRPLGDIHFSTQSAAQVELKLWEMEERGLRYRLVEYVPKVKK